MDGIVLRSILTECGCTAAVSLLFHCAREPPPDYKSKVLSVNGCNVVIMAALSVHLIYPLSLHEKYSMVFLGYLFAWMLFFAHVTTHMNTLRTINAKPIRRGQGRLVSMMVDWIAAIPPPSTVDYPDACHCHSTSRKARC
jgi:hypothetical protein